MFSCFVNYSTLTTDQRIQATLMQNLFENVHTVRKEEATWSGRLPCAFFQSLPSGIPLLQPIILNDATLLSPKQQEVSVDKPNTTHKLVIM